MPNSSLFLNVLSNQPVDRTPVWLMRQAGRYLPEYRALREKTRNFLELCRTPELAAEVTLQPIKRFPLDAAILFADILLVPNALGMSLDFVDTAGPIFSQPIREKNQLANLSLSAIPEFAQPTLQAIHLVKKQLPQNIPLIGFAGSPWTVATYMIEGRGSTQFSVIKKMCYQNSELLKNILQLLVNATTQWLNLQIKAGVDCIMLFDTWGGILSAEDYQNFSLNPMTEICEKIRQQTQIPIILFSKGVRYPAAIKQLPINAVGIDWTWDLSAAKQALGNMALQGNLDPATLYSEPKVIRKAVQQCLASYGHGHRHIFNLGHGVNPDINPDHVAVLVDAVQEYSKIYHI